MRAAFLEALQTEDVTCFKFVDETSTNLTYCRRYARARGGQRAHQATPLHGGPNVTLVAARGARLLYLPPYSPDFNPIELAFSKLKTWLRTAQARARVALEAVIQDASNWITEHDAKNWFDHCGYHVH